MRKALIIAYLQKQHYQSWSVGHQTFVITDTDNFYVIVVLCIYYWSCDSQLINSIFCFSKISRCDKYNYTF